LPLRHVSLAETGSTNDAVAERAAAGEAEGLWLRAERQTAGRGRRGREWTSSTGNLHVSSFVRVRRDDPPTQTLALVAAIALFDATERYVPRARLTIKWPNDLLLSGMKLAGILLERSDDVVVIGFGVNLASHPTDLERPATSLTALGVEPPAPEDFAQALAPAFATWLARWRSEGLPAVRTAWMERAHPIGMALVARLADGEEITGAFDGLAEDGALRLRLVDGALRSIHAADVFTL
jgi:BirA family biotin operon repressor/biotin-[acetyl-CoA-carboxylase] ligase